MFVIYDFHFDSSLNSTRRRWPCRLSSRLPSSPSPNTWSRCPTSWPFWAHCVRRCPQQRGGRLWGELTRLPWSTWPPQLNGINHHRHRPRSTTTRQALSQHLHQACSSRSSKYSSRSLLSRVPHSQHRRRPYTFQIWVIIHFHPYLAQTSPLGHLDHDGVHHLTHPYSSCNAYIMMYIFPYLNNYFFMLFSIVY